MKPDRRLTAEERDHIVKSLAPAVEIVNRISFYHGISRHTAMKFFRIAREKGGNA